MKKAIQGIDVSHWNGTIDFDKVKEAGFDFAIAKASDGVRSPDKMFRSNLERIKAAGLIPGAYHFARPSSIGTPKDAVEEALDFVGRIKSAGGLGSIHLPPAIDFEEYSPNGPTENETWIGAFVRTVEAELGCSPMIYTGRNVWKFELGNSDDFAHLPVWLVKYSKRRTVPKFLGRTPDLWQWSGGGDFAFGPKVNGRILDLNRYTGSNWTDLITPRIRSAVCS
jgi:lysozyme